MKKEPLYEVFKKTELDYIKNGNCQFTSKTYKVQYNHKLKGWRCSCAGFVKSGGKATCKHITCGKLLLFMLAVQGKLS